MLWIIAALLLFIIQIAFVVVVEYRRTNKAVSWLIVLFMFPIVGFLPYYFLAKEYTLDNRILRGEEYGNLERIRKDLANRCKQRMPEEMLDEADRQWQLAILQNLSTAPAYCNETIVFEEGEQAFEAMLDSISAAERHIHIEFYIIRDDDLGSRLERLLIRKAQEGIHVRFLYDGIGSRQLGKAYLKRLRNGGVETGSFFPPATTLLHKRLNYRNHRKIVVVDGNIGFLGGLNIGDEYLGKDPYFGYWRDTHFSIKGDAVLWIQYTFLTDWLLVKGEALTDPDYFPVQPCEGNELVQIVKSGPDETILELIFSLIVSAKKRIYLESPYFIPDPGVLLALKTAVSRGVEVIVVIPSFPDKKLVYWATMSYIQELLEVGVRFYRYRKGFIHSKVLITDDLACSGSANMDMRSLSDQFELSAVFFDGKTVNRLIQDFLRDLSLSEEILLTDFVKRPRNQKMKEAFARLLSPLF